MTFEKVSVIRLDGLLNEVFIIGIFENKYRAQSKCFLFTRWHSVIKIDIKWYFSFLGNVYY